MAAPTKRKQVTTHIIAIALAEGFPAICIEKDILKKKIVKDFLLVKRAIMAEKLESSGLLTME